MLRMVQLSLNEQYQSLCGSREGPQCSSSTIIITIMILIVMILIVMIFIVMILIVITIVAIISSIMNFCSSYYDY